MQDRVRLRAGRHRQAIRTDACAKQRKKNQQRQSSSSAKGQPDWPVQFSSRNVANPFAQRQHSDQPVQRAGWAEDGLSALGATLGKPETVQLGFDANKYAPTLRTLDRYGHRLDEVDFHPAWHA